MIAQALDVAVKRDANMTERADQCPERSRVTQHGRAAVQSPIDRQEYAAHSGGIG